MNPINSKLQAAVWQDDHLQLLDQRLLPSEQVYIDLYDAPQTALAITDMVVRGAPAIGVTAAYGVVLAARHAYAKHPDAWRDAVQADMAILAAARPTAINLHWALQTLGDLFADIDGNPEAILLAKAKQIHEKDIADNQHMGSIGAGYLAENCRVLTHCNAGALATGGYGTALGVIRSGVSADKISKVYADETRPWLQGARLTAWELLQDGIPVTLLADSAAARLMQQGKIDWVIVGSDRIAANGDVANKIGTYSLAVLARYHGIKFMVAAPLSTVDYNVARGDDIPIEDRAAEEVLSVFEQRVAAQGADAWNPVFDVTPAELVDVIVTEKGAVENPTTAKMAALRDKPV